MVTAEARSVKVTAAVGITRLRVATLIFIDQPQGQGDKTLGMPQFPGVIGRPADCVDVSTASAQEFERA
jgi:hypothetical protein